MKLLPLAATISWLAVALALLIEPQPNWVMPLVLIPIAIFATVHSLGVAGVRALFTSRTRGRIQVLVGVLLVLAAPVSLVAQESLTTSTLSQLGQQFEYAESTATFEILETPRQRAAVGAGYAAASYSVAVKIESLAGEPIHCALSPALTCPIRGRLSYSAEDLDLAIGDRVSTTAFFTPNREPGRDTFSARAGSISLVSSGGGFGVELVDWLRASFMQNLRGLDQGSASLVAGLAIGEVSALPFELKRDMQTTGLTHLTAVSGANCAIVIALAIAVIAKTRIGRVGRAVATIAVLVGYVALVGQQPSVLRAAVMVGAVTLAATIGKKTHALDALAVTTLVLLTADPWLAIDFGFALSALATCGLVLLAPSIESWLSRRMPPWLAQGTSIVLSAQLLCLPLIIALASALPIYSVPANLLVEPLVAPITVLGLLAVLVPVPLVAQVFSWLASIPAAWVAWVAHWFAGLPSAQLEWPSGALGIALAIAVTALLLLVILKRNASRWVRISLAICVAVGLSHGLARPLTQATWPVAGWQVVACDVGQGDSLVIRSAGQIAVIDAGREPELVNECLDELGIVRIDLLVLSHFDMDHVGGLAGVLEGREVAMSLVTPWPDTRPAVGLVAELLTAQGISATFAEDGMSGQLGDFAWRVLAPSRTAVEAEDSNDGSVILEFLSDSVNILALADLGERGQMRLVQSHPELLGELAGAPTILKVAHHGSADCYPELYEALIGSYALISVGAKNSYGHPTQTALSALRRANARVLRTDLLGSIALGFGSGEPALGVTGGR